MMIECIRLFGIDNRNFWLLIAIRLIWFCVPHKLLLYPVCMSNTYIDETFNCTTKSQPTIKTHTSSSSSHSVSPKITNILFKLHLPHWQFIIRITATTQKHPHTKRDSLRDRNRDNRTAQHITHTVLNILRSHSLGNEPSSMKASIPNHLPSLPPPSPTRNNQIPTPTPC